MKDNESPFIATKGEVTVSLGQYVAVDSSKDEVSQKELTISVAEPLDKQDQL